MIDVAVTDRVGARAGFTVRPGERLLHAGLAAGLGLPYECATGACGSCKATVTGGETESLWAEAPGRRVCRRPGEILMCQTAAKSGPIALGISSAFRTSREPACALRRGRVASFRRLTDDVGSFSVELDEPIDHLPGQFVLLSAPGVEGPRAYSMTGYAPTQRRLDFLARISAEGGFTPRLFSNALEGLEIEVFGPLGRAALRPEDDRPFVAIAGGSGVAGLLSIVEAALARGYCDRRPSRIVFGLRHMKGSYLLDRLSDAVRRSHGGFAATVSFSDETPAPEFEAIYPDLDFTTGFVHDVVRGGLASASAEKPIYFVAGPPPMVDATMRMLVVEAKVSPAEIRFDRFG